MRSLAECARIAPDLTLFRMLVQYDICELRETAPRVLMRGLQQADAALKELQAVVDQWPKTEDGVPIFPRMKVYGSWYGGGTVRSIDENRVYVQKSDEWAFHEFHECSSTVEAAEKARRK